MLLARGGGCSSGGGGGGDGCFALRLLSLACTSSGDNRRVDDSRLCTHCGDVTNAQHVLKRVFGLYTKRRLSRHSLFLSLSPLKLRTLAVLPNAMRIVRADTLVARLVARANVQRQSVDDRIGDCDQIALLCDKEASNR